MQALSRTLIHIAWLGIALIAFAADRPTLAGSSVIAATILPALIIPMTKGGRR